MDEQLSVAAILKSLEVGQSYCMARRLEQDTTTGEQIRQAIEALHNNASAAIARATKATGFKYSGERGEFRTNRGFNPVACYLITREKG